MSFSAVWEPSLNTVRSCPELNDIESTCSVRFEFFFLSLIYLHTIREKAKHNITIIIIIIAWIIYIEGSLGFSLLSLLSLFFFSKNFVKSTGIE